MKVLTSAQMGEVDRRTEAAGIPEVVLMENAGHRVVEFLIERWPILSKHRIVVLCGKGKNGGDGFVIARQLFTRFRPKSLHVAATHPENDSDALRMLRACGCPVYDSITQEMRAATLVIDALLGTGLKGPARDKAADWIREINSSFSSAKVIAVDVPSGMNSDSGTSEGDVARADACVTFTALKICHALPPNCDQVGDVTIGNIGSPEALMSDVQLHLSSPSGFCAPVTAPATGLQQRRLRTRASGRRRRGQVGSCRNVRLGGFRAGAGLSTVASSALKFSAPELMADGLPQSWSALEPLLHRKRVLAIGTGLGTADWAVSLVRDALRTAKQPMVIDADALNVLAGYDWNVRWSIPGADTASRRDVPIAGYIHRSSSK